MSNRIGRKKLAKILVRLHCDKKKFQLKNGQIYLQQKLIKLSECEMNFFLCRIFIGSYQRRSQTQAPPTFFLEPKSHFFSKIEGKSLGAKFTAIVRFEDSMFSRLRCKNVIRPILDESKHLKLGFIRCIHIVR